MELAPSGGQGMSDPPRDSTIPTGPVGVTTTALITVTLRPDGDSLRVGGVVDSFTVSRGPGIPLPTDSTAPRAEFTATLAPNGRVSGFTGARDSTCSPALEPLLGLAREVLVPAPTFLAVGQTWRDSSTVVTCRGGIAITAVVVRDYRVEGPDLQGSVPAIRLSRLTSTTLEGSGSEYGRTLVFTGSGKGRALLYLDARTGAFLGSVSESDATVSLGTPREQTPFRQQVRQKVVLVQDR